MKTVLKWVGGKSRPLPVLKRSFPDYERLVEPFVGGGAVMLDQEHKPAIINDYNSQLMDFYRQVKEDPEVLINKLATMVNTKEEYLKIRSKQPTDQLDIAARVLYLNKLCFNGMWRENASGGFNVPYGKKEGRPFQEFYKEKQLRDLHNRLQTVEIMDGDYWQLFKYAEEGDFYFLDPPYVDTWSDYTKDGFGSIEHEQLVKGLKMLNALGVKFMLTNSYNKVTRALYKDFNQTTVGVMYGLGGKGSKRANRDEIVVTNY